MTNSTKPTIDVQQVNNLLTAVREQRDRALNDLAQAQAALMTAAQTIQALKLQIEQRDQMVASLKHAAEAPELPMGGEKANGHTNGALQ